MTAKKKTAPKVTPAEEVVVEETPNVMSFDSDQMVEHFQTALEKQKQAVETMTGMMFANAQTMIQNVFRVPTTPTIPPGE